MLIRAAHFHCPRPFLFTGAFIVGSCSRQPHLKQISGESICSSFKLVLQSLKICNFLDLGTFHQVTTWICLVIWKLGKLCLALVVLRFFPPHLFSISCFLSQAHGSGRPEELHLLAESEPRCHGVCRAGICNVQSTSETAVMVQHEKDASFLQSLCWLFSFPPSWKTQNDHNQVHSPTTQARNKSTFYMHLKKKLREWFSCLCCGERGRLLLKYHMSLSL